EPAEHCVAVPRILFSSAPHLPLHGHCLHSRQSARHSHRLAHDYPPAPAPDGAEQGTEPLPQGNRQVAHPGRQRLTDMQELLFLGLFMAALAIGWFLGRREAIKVGVMLAPHGSAIDKQYFIGLNYLLNEQPDEAIETFIRALEVNPETVETHIAIGKLFCQRGDVERAIKVHQNLLARPNLTTQQADRVQFELARDYLAVGLHHRAERLLDELVESGSSLSADALSDLVRIHERERDWQQAVAVGKRLLRERESFAVTLAHYHCELAREAQARQEWPQARRHLLDALATQRNSVRAMLMLAELEAGQGRDREVLKWLRRLAVNDPDFIPQALPLLQSLAAADHLD